MQKNKGELPKHKESKQVQKEEQTKAKLKNKQPDRTTQRKTIDEQDSDGSGGAFEEFIDQQNDE